MSPDRRDILEQVARGEITPEEADRLLSGQDLSAEAASPPPPPGSDSPIQKIKVVAGFGAIVVVGDPDVAEADVEGAHSASIDGDTLVIRGDVEAVTPGAFAIHLGPRRHRVGGVRIGSHHASSLRVRMNPALDLEAKIDAGPLSISGINASIRARAAAGPITIEDFDGPLDVW
jgi:hypothetical protein